MPKGADDAKEAMVVRLESLELDKLAFDHGEIIQDYLKRFHPSIL